MEFNRSDSKRDKVFRTLDSVQITGLYSWGPPTIASRVEIDAPKTVFKALFGHYRS